MTELPLDIDSLMTRAAHLARAEMATRPSTSSEDEQSQLEKSSRNVTLVCQLVELITAEREPDTAVRVLRTTDRICSPSLPRRLEGKPTRNQPCLTVLDSAS